MGLFGSKVTKSAIVIQVRCKVSSKQTKTTLLVLKPTLTLILHNSCEQSIPIAHYIKRHDVTIKHLSRARSFMQKAFMRTISERFIRFCIAINFSIGAPGFVFDSSRIDYRLFMSLFILFIGCLEFERWKYWNSTIFLFFIRSARVDPFRAIRDKKFGVAPYAKTPPPDGPPVPFRRYNYSRNMSTNIKIIIHEFNYCPNETFKLNFTR